MALAALPGRRLGRGRWRMASPPAEPRALVLGTAAAASLQRPCQLHFCGKTLTGRMGGDLGTRTGLSPRKPRLQLCCLRLPRVWSQEQLSPRLQLWQAVGLGSWTGCRGRRWTVPVLLLSGDASSLPHWGGGLGWAVEKAPEGHHHSCRRQGSGLGAAQCLVTQQLPEGLLPTGQGGAAHWALAPLHPALLRPQSLFSPRLPSCEAAVPPPGLLLAGAPVSTCPSFGPAALARDHERNFPCESSMLALCCGAWAQQHPLSCLLRPTSGCS